MNNKMYSFTKVTGIELSVYFKIDRTFFDSYISWQDYFPRLSRMGMEI